MESHGFSQSILFPTGCMLFQTFLNGTVFVLSLLLYFLFISFLFFSFLSRSVLDGFVRHTSRRPMGMDGDNIKPNLQHVGTRRA